MSTTPAPHAHLRCVLTEGEQRLGVLLLSRSRGLGSLLSLVLTLGLLVTFTLSALTEGRTPLLVAA